MPPMAAPCADPHNGNCFTPASTPYGRHHYTMFQFMLPHMEQQNVYDQLSLTGYAGGKYNIAFPMLNCPTDPSIKQGMNLTSYGGAKNWGASSYAGNNYVFGDPPGKNTYGAATLPASVPDGQSNTVFFAEIYGTCGSSGNIDLLWGSLWADANSIWRPGFNLGGSKSGTNVASYPPSPMFQIAPHFINTCDPERPQAAHPGSLGVCLGDGSVRYLAGTMEETIWAYLADPRDRQVVGNF